MSVALSVENHSSNSSTSTSRISCFCIVSRGWGWMGDSESIKLLLPYFPNRVGTG